MKILLSAYACEPNKGSEPGVGWSWATELAKKHEVWVITRDNNEPTITEYMQVNPNYQNDNLHFIYVGLSKKLTFWKKGRRGMRLFYMLWQKKAVKIAAEWNKIIGFDFVQHVTFVSYTQPTYMYKLGIPLIWGPVSGGENIPFGIKIKMSKKEWIIESVRKLSQYMALITPSVRKTMKKSKYIFVATEETREKIPQKYQKKASILPAIGIERMPNASRIDRNDSKVKIVMAGRLIYWKAFDIGLKGFLKIADQHPNAELHILGEGNKKDELKRLAGKYLNKQVFFEKPIPHDQIYEFYKKFDIFLNTTLRDSGCMTMMEAMSVGLPCVAIATGGPKVLLMGEPIGSINVKDYDSTVQLVSSSLANLIVDARIREQLSLTQYDYVQKFIMECKVDYLIDRINKK